MGGWADSLYVDGVLADTKPVTTAAFNVDHLFLGVTEDGNERMVGYTDELRVAKQALTPSWIRVEAVNQVPALLPGSPLVTVGPRQVP